MVLCAAFQVGKHHKQESKFEEETKMNILDIRLARFMCISGLLLCLTAGTLQSQMNATGSKVIMPTRDKKVYVLDLMSWSVTPLSISIKPGNSFMLSPNQKFLTLMGIDGITFYELEGSVLGGQVQVTADPVGAVIWSEDSKSLVYVREISNSDGSISVQFYRWDRETGQTKRLL